MKPNRLLGSSILLLHHQTTNSISDRSSDLSPTFTQVFCLTLHQHFHSINPAAVMFFASVLIPFPSQTLSLIAPLQTISFCPTGPVAPEHPRLQHFMSQKVPPSKAQASSLHFQYVRKPNDPRSFRNLLFASVRSFLLDTRPQGIPYSPLQVTAPATSHVNNIKPIPFLSSYGKFTYISTI